MLSHLLRINLLSFFRTGDRRLSRFRSVVRAALRQAPYRDVLRREELQGALELRSQKDLEDLLRQLPAQSLETVAAHWPAAALRPGPARWQQPLNSTGRIAVLEGKGRDSDRLRFFASADSPKLRDFQPGSLAATISTLRETARNVIAGKLELSVSQSIIAFTGATLGWMTESDRDLFWRAFGVPVYEQVLAPSGELLAWSCETHEGLHVHQQSACFETSSDGELLVTSLVSTAAVLLKVRTGVWGQVSSDPCPCGRPGMMLADLTMPTYQPVLEGVRTAQAATACNAMMAT